jgi:hypothetical protein
VKQRQVRTAGLEGRLDCYCMCTCLKFQDTARAASENTPAEHARYVHYAQARCMQASKQDICCCVHVACDLLCNQDPPFLHQPLRGHNLWLCPPEHAARGSRAQSLARRLLAVAAAALLKQLQPCSSSCSPAQAAKQGMWHPSR